jgi:predicted ribonuclease YlaK
MQTPKGRKLTKRERRIRRQQGAEDGSINTNDRFNFTLKAVSPLTENQHNTFDSYNTGKHLLLIGSAGTGKTYVALYLALKDIMEISEYKQIIIIRSTVQSRDQGFMPGNDKQKASYFESPYVDIVNDLFNRGDAYQTLTNKGVLKFMTTSFIRGMTFDDSLIIVDECQSCNFHELDTIMTRVGKNSRILFCGDVKQDDLKVGNRNKNDTSGLGDLIYITKNIKSFDIVEFSLNDIVRSGLVKEYLIAKERFSSL